MRMIIRVVPFFFIQLVIHRNKKKTYGLNFLNDEEPKIQQ